MDPDLKIYVALAGMAFIGWIVTLWILYAIIRAGVRDGILRADGVRAKQAADKLCMAEKPVARLIKVPSSPQSCNPPPPLLRRG